jgi:hypothetical protein
MFLSDVQVPAIQIFLGLHEVGDLCDRELVPERVVGLEGIDTGDRLGNNDRAIGSGPNPYYSFG